MEIWSLAIQYNAIELYGAEDCLLREFNQALNAVKINHVIDTWSAPWHDIVYTHTLAALLISCNLYLITIYEHTNSTGPVNETSDEHNDQLFDDAKWEHCLS